MYKYVRVCELVLCVRVCVMLCMRCVVYFDIVRNKINNTFSVVV
jgi:hypothetical protein